MSPKTATRISLAFLSLSVTTLITLSSATHTDCSAFGSVSDILKYYDIPQGLFPDDVQYFKCDPVNKDAHKISIRLHGACNVTRTLLELSNTFTCQSEIAAIISYHQLTNIKGITVVLSIRHLPVGDLMTVTGAKVYPIPIVGQVLQFYVSNGLSGPAFPVALIGNKPPTCDYPSSSNNAAVHYDLLGSAGVFVAAKDDNHDDDADVPTWVYKYGHLLPFVAA